MILNETLETLKNKADLSQLGIKEIFLSSFFNAVKLSNSSVGAAMSYSRVESPADTGQTAARLLSIVKSDPLLLGLLFKSNAKNLLKESLKTAVLSAISKDLILSDSSLRIENELDKKIFSGINSAAIIGFGGYMDMIVRQTKIANIHISDSSYNERANEMDSQIQEYRGLFPGKKITISSGYDNSQKIGAADLVSITGSALCNGTMDQLLGFSKNCKKVIVQGQSAAIHPGVLFQKGASLVATTIKPENLIEVANSDFAKFQRLLEGGLPIIHISPKAI